MVEISSWTKACGGPHSEILLWCGGGGCFLLKFHASYDSYYFILLMTEILHQLKMGSVSHGAVYSYIPAG